MAIVRKTITYPNGTVAAGPVSIDDISNGTLTTALPGSGYWIDVAGLATDGAGTAADPYTGWDAALAAAMANGVTFLFRGIFSAAQNIDAQNRTGVHLLGTNGYGNHVGFGDPEIGAPQAQILFSGQGPNINLIHTNGCRISNLKIAHTAPTVLTAAVIDNSGSDGDAIGEVSSGLIMENVVIDGGNTDYPLCCLLLDGTVASTLDNVMFHRARYGIIGIKDHIYSCTVNVRGGWFQNQSQAPVLNPHMQWAFENVVFEPMAGGSGKWVKWDGDMGGASGAAANLISFSGCYMWDNAGGGDVFDLATPIYGLTLIGCSTNSVGGTVIKPNGHAIYGLALLRNAFNNGSQGAGNGTLFPSAGSWGTISGAHISGNTFGAGVDNIAQAVKAGRIADGVVVDSAGTLLLPGLRAATDAPALCDRMGYVEASAAVFTANRAEFVPLLVERRIAINRVFFKVNASSGNIDVGIYDDDGTDGAPATKLVSSGSVACPAIGVAAVAVASTILNPGRYWVAISGDNGTVALYYGDVKAYVDAILGTVRYQKTSAFPLPSTVASPSAVAGTTIFGIFAGRV